MKNDIHVANIAIKMSIDKTIISFALLLNFALVISYLNKIIIFVSIYYLLTTISLEPGGKYGLSSSDLLTTFKRLGSISFK